jgi:uncharacterized protein
MLGLAYSSAIPNFVRQYPDSVDFTEVPFELLNHDPRVIEVREYIPVVLHCASLSIAGTVPCPAETIERIDHWLKETSSPWLGEHLAFVTADRVEAGKCAESYAPGEPYNIGYTVSPPMNNDVVNRVSQSLAAYQKHFPVRLLIENSPLYFRTPGSTMSQVDFIRSISERTDAGLLLDLAHFYISSQTMGFNAIEEIVRLPLHKVVEVHISGVSADLDATWDDHAQPAPAAVYDLLRVVMRHCNPRAITLEYNWSSRVSDSFLHRQLEATRAAAGL